MKFRISPTLLRKFEEKASRVSAGRMSILEREWLLLHPPTADHAIPFSIRVRLPDFIPTLLANVNHSATPPVSSN